MLLLRRRIVYVFAIFNKSIRRVPSNANITRQAGHAEAAQHMSNDPDIIADDGLVLQCGHDEAILRYIIRTAIAASIHSCE